MNIQAHKRINGSSLSEHIGQSVTLLGEFVKVEPNGRIFTLKTCSNDIVTVQLQEPVQELLEGILEVQGIVSPNNTLQCQNFVSFPKDFTEKIDMQLYNEVITLTTRFPQHYITMQ